jgi:ankyrin repeat protein
LNFFRGSPESDRIHRSFAVELVKLLLGKGAVVNEGNEDGITPLHGAAYKGAK